MMKTILLAAMIALTGSATYAQSVNALAVQACFEGAGPGDITPSCISYASHQCRAAPGNETTIGAIACIEAETAEWDRLLNEQYGIVRRQLQARDPALASDLLDAQRAWIVYRDAECGLKAARISGGSLRGVVFAGCMMSETAERALELRDKRIE